MNDILESQNRSIPTDWLVDLSLASLVCPENAKFLEIVGDKEYITISIQSDCDEKKITVRNKWGVYGFNYWHPISALKGDEQDKGKVYLDINTGNIINIKTPLKTTEFCFG